MSNTKIRKLKIVRTSTQPLRLAEGEAIHVGVDVHKASYSVALYRLDRGSLTETGPNRVPGIGLPGCPGVDFELKS
jgi:hypothetical protein